MKNVSTTRHIRFKKLLMDMLQNKLQDQSEQSDKPPLAQSNYELFENILKQSDCQNEETFRHLQIFSQNLEKAPNILVSFLSSDSIESETEKITLNSSASITKIYNQILSKTNQQINTFPDVFYQGDGQLPNDFEIEGQERELNFEQIYADESSMNMIAEILDVYVGEIAQCFSEGKETIAQMTKLIDQQIKRNQIMNTYVLFGLLKQMSSESYKIISQNVQKRFPNFSEQQKKSFVLYIQKNYEFMNLQRNLQIVPKILTKKQQNIFYSSQNQKWLSLIKNCPSNIELKKLTSTQGTSGFLLIKKKSSINLNQSKEQPKTQQSENGTENELILRVQEGGKIAVTHAKVCQKSWKIINNNKMQVTQLYEVLKKQIQKSQNKQKDYYSYGLPTGESATIGGTLGKCLADINQYHNANAFLLDLSKTTAICGTLSYAIAQIPILSYLIVAGGFTYSFYSACTNQATSAQRKMNQVGCATMSAVGSIGSTFGGILLGQALIPVPIVGAFFGGIFGGFVGTKGVRKANAIISKTNFRDIIKHIKNKIIDERCWRFNQKTLQILGINKQYFNSQVSSLKNQNKDIYITAIIFCVITFYESKRYIERNQIKMKEAKKKIKDKKPQSDEEVFQNEFDIVKIVDYLTQSNFSLLQNMPKLQNCILHLAS